jgi:hypothetical protein
LGADILNFLKAVEYGYAELVAMERLGQARTAKDIGKSRGYGRYP